MNYRPLRILTVAFAVILLPLVVFAAPPKFSGEIWAGSEVTSTSGPVNVYWVFDGGVFNEYIYYYQTDEIRLMTSGRYSSCESAGHTTYTMSVGIPTTEAVMARSDIGTEPGLNDNRASVRLVQVTLSKENGYLVFPRGDRITRVDTFTQFVMPVEHPPSVTTMTTKLKPKAELNYQGCCGDCYAVHDFLGISWLNGICCNSSCGGGGSSFGGGGAGGGW
jgi:hypothetical protein